MGELQISAMNMIKVQDAQIQIQFSQLNREVENLQSELKMLLRVDYAINPTLDSLSSNFVKVLPNSVDQFHPLIQINDALIEQKKAATQIEKSKLSPSVNLGYSNLSIKGWQTADGVNQQYYGPQNRFGIYQLGLGIPIFSGAAKARIKASRIQEDIAMDEKNQQISRLNTELNKLNATHAQLITARSYYENEGLKIAHQNMDISTLRLKGGDLPFSEWLMLVNQSIQIKTSYLDIIHQLDILSADYIYLNEKK